MQKMVVQRQAQGFDGRQWAGQKGKKVGASMENTLKAARAVGQAGRHGREYSQQPGSHATHKLPGPVPVYKLQVTGRPFLVARPMQCKEKKKSTRLNMPRLPFLF